MARNDNLLPGLGGKPMRVMPEVPSFVAGSDLLPPIRISPRKLQPLDDVLLKVSGRAQLEDDDFLLAKTRIETELLDPVLSTEDRERYQRLVDLRKRYDTSTDPDARRKLRQEAHRIEAAFAQADRAERESHEALRRHMRHVYSVVSQLYRWIEKLPRPFRLERPTVDATWMLVDKMRSGRGVYRESDYLKKQITTPDSFKIDIATFSHREVPRLRVEHDWAGAMAKGTSEDLAAEFKPPAPVAMFEFQIDGHLVVAPVIDLEKQKNRPPDIGAVGFPLCLHHPPTDEWFITSVTDWDVDGWCHHRVPNDVVGEFCEFIGWQLRAICIALDAEVAVRKVVRSPYAGSPRDSKPVQVGDEYHVVSLATRARAARLDGPSLPTGRHVKMHFRRGHWRHYEDYRTWIKWMLVGDPDLGFVDKHYRL